MTFEHPGNMHIPRLVQLLKEAFGEYDGFWELFLDTAFLPDHCRCIIENHQVIAGLYWFDCSCGQDKIAYIYAVVTDPRHRGRGLCRKLMALTHKDLEAEGYAGSLLMPAGGSLRNMYAKMGYRDCTRLTEFTCEAGASHVTVHTVSEAEYAALRRRFLPEGGVLQEGDNITYLATYAGLYAGEGFVLAAVHEKEKLFALELLGDREKAPGILKAMGYAEGTFRVPGEELAFAMFYPLRDDAPIPSYLGLAFD